MSACHSGRVLPDYLGEIACVAIKSRLGVVVLGYFRHPGIDCIINPGVEIGSLVEVLAVGSFGANEGAIMDVQPKNRSEAIVPCQRSGTVLCSSRVVGCDSLVPVGKGIGGGNETSQVGGRGKGDGSELHGCVF